MDSSPKEQLTVENPEAIFNKTLANARLGVGLLTNFAIDQQTLSHEATNILDEVFAPDGHILLPPISIVRKELIKMHGDNDMSRRTRALCSTKTGEVFIPEEQAGSTHDLIHESLHRASWLTNNKLGDQNGTLMIRQLAERYGITIKDGKIDLESPYIQKYAQTDTERQDLSDFFTETLKREHAEINEGLAEWATRYVTSLQPATENFQMDDKDNAYNDLVADVEMIRAKIIEKDKVSLKQADAILVASALTGDISKISRHLM